MTLRRSHRTAPSRTGGGAGTAPPVNGHAAATARDGAALTVLVANDAHEKTRLLEALAEGGAPDDVHRRRRAAAAGPGPSAASNGHGAPPMVPEAAPRAADALLAARLRLATARHEEAQLDAEPDDVLPPDPPRVLQLVGESADYRARLLALAATRARLVACEQTIAACEHRLAAFACAPHAVADELAAAMDELLGWQQRVGRARAADAAATGDATAASAAARRLSARASQELARDAGGDAAELDTRWRRLWRLRRALEEIWEVQSRAEAEARALAEGEAAWRAADAWARWRPSRRLLTFSGAAALAGSLIALGSGYWLGETPDVRQGGLAMALVLLHATLWLRGRVVGRSAARHRDAQERQRTILGDRRRRRDRDWSRAAQLTTAIENDAEALGLPLTVTPDVIEACEHAMADDLRRDGAETPLTELLCELLAAQDESEHAEARLAAAAAERSAVEREWMAWRDATGLPPALDAAQIGEWLDTRDRLAATRAAHAEESARLARLEPATAAWEAEVRTLIAAAGQAIAPDACGQALTAELAALGRRVRAARLRQRRRQRLATELRAAAAAVVAAEAAAAPTGALPRPPAPTVDSGPASPRSARLLETASAILAYATNGGYTGLRAAPNGGVLVVNDSDDAIPLTAIPDRAGRRCAQFLLRLGEALIAPPRLLVVDDALAGLHDDEAATVARAIAALATTRPLVYVTSRTTRSRALRLLPGTARVLE
jgi:hypothetical protein